MSNAPSTIHSLFYFNKEQSANILQVLGKFMLRKAVSQDSNESEKRTPLALPFSYVAPSISSMSHHYNIDVEPPIVSDVVSDVDNTLTPLVPLVPLQIEYHCPKHQDTLFWCIFIAAYGYDEYLQVSRNYGVKELEIKQKVGNWLQTNLSKMKNTNMKVTKVAIQEIMSELITTVKETSIMSMLAMIVHFNINIILVDSTGAVMLEFKADKDADNESVQTYILQKDSFGKYKLRSDPLSKEQVEEFKKTVVVLESHLRPLKPITNYQTDDLKNIARRLGGFDETYKYKKAELYEELSEAMKWK